MASIHQNLADALMMQRDYTLAGASTTDRHTLRVDITDNTTNTGGYQRGLYLNFTGAGDKTTSAEVNVISADVTLTGDTPYSYNLCMYTCESGNPTIGFKAAISIYMDALGTAVGAQVAIDIGIAEGTNSPSGRDAYMRWRNHSASNEPASGILLEAGNNESACTYLFDQLAAATGPIAKNTGTISSTCTHAIKCRHGADEFWLSGTAEPS